MNHVSDNVEKVIWDNVPGSVFRNVFHIFNNANPESRAAFAVAWDIRAMAKL